MTDYRNALPPGFELDRGRYVITDVLGAGGFGIVYRVTDRRRKIDRAIKEFLPSAVALREGTHVHPLNSQVAETYAYSLKSFQEEARKLRFFAGHRNVAQCTDYFEAHGTGYLVMAYQDGLPLTELLARREALGNPLREWEIIGILIPLLEGLAAVHAEDMLHRDIKPGNIFIRREDGQPVLLDFGAAKQDFSRRSKSRSAYTEGYASMELVDEDGVLGPWTDVYSVGGVMWRALVGEHPRKVEDRMAARFRGRPDPLALAPERLQTSCSEALLDLMERCLALEPGLRLQSAELVRNALRPVESQAAKTFEQGDAKARVSNSGAVGGQGRRTPTESGSSEGRRAEPGSCHEAGRSRVSGRARYGSEPFLDMARLAEVSDQAERLGRSKRDSDGAGGEDAGPAVGPGVPAFGGLVPKRGGQSTWRGRSAGLSVRLAVWAGIGLVASVFITFLLQNTVGAPSGEFSEAELRNGIISFEGPYEEMIDVQFNDGDGSSCYDEDEVRYGDWYSIASIFLIDPRNGRSREAITTFLSGPCGGNDTWALTCQTTKGNGGFRLDCFDGATQSHLLEGRRLVYERRVWQPLDPGVCRPGGCGVAACEVVLPENGVSAPSCLLEAPTRFEHELKSGGDGPEMVVVPDGEFWRGSEKDESGHQLDEQPVDTVKISRLALSRYPITVGDFRRFVEATNYRTDAETNGGCRPHGALTGSGGVGPSEPRRSATSWRDPGFIEIEGRTQPQAKLATEDTHPVVCISWNDAKRYVEWLAAEAGASYRLASETELEYVIRGGTTTPYPWGNAIGDRCKQGNFWAGCESRSYSYLRSIYKMEEGEWGVAGLNGEVASWAEDCYADSYLGVPTDGRSRLESSCRSTTRVARGSSWATYASYEGVDGVVERSAFRDFAPPNATSNALGFRVALTISPTP